MMEEKTQKMNPSNQVSLAFAAIDPYQIIQEVSPTEKILVRDSNIVAWGDRNQYPDYLLSLYNDVGTLRSIINGCIDYTLGDGAEFSEDYTNSKGDTYEDILRKLVKDYWIYGGFAYQVIRNKIGESRELIYLDFRKVRSNERGTEFYYAQDWSKTVGRCKYVTYPKFDPNDPSQATGIVYVKNIDNQVYPTPVYGAKTTIQACEIEKAISTYHQSNLQSGFLGSYLFQFFNGIPEDAQKKEVEQKILEKFAGTSALRFMLNFAEDKEHGLDITKLETEDFGEKYQTLAKKAQQELFTAFRAHPNLFGLPTENLGFNSEEYDSTFKLFNRTMIRPVQRMLVSLFEKQGIELTIKPFSIELGE